VTTVDLGLEGKVAAVTGGGAGIGGAVVDRLAAAGAAVTFVEVDEDRAAGRVAAVSRAGGRAEAIVGDITDPDTVEALAQAVPRCDVLVNNVGHHLRATPFLASDPDRWDALDAINVRHVLACCRALVPGMADRGSGAVVNVSSVEGLRGFPPDPVYAAGKAAVIHFTRSLAMEVAPSGVRVNAVAPDVTQTPQVDYASWVPPEDAHRWATWVPLGRPGAPEDVADVVVLLASDLARFVTGQVVATDGGTLTAGGWFRTGDGRWTNRPRDP
jgi:NAD(P)-dependent dehydrogenase (short-subunit alcohol dehydrogenase family)